MNSARNVVVLSAVLGSVGGFFLGRPIDLALVGLVVGGILFGLLGYLLFSATRLHVLWWLGATTLLSVVIVGSYVVRSDVLKERYGQSLDGQALDAVDGATNSDGANVATTVATTTTQPTTTTIPIPAGGIAYSDTEGLAPDVIRWAVFQNEDGDGVATVAVFDSVKIDRLPASGQFRIVSGRLFEGGGSPMAALEDIQAYAFDDLGEAAAFEWADPASYNFRLCAPSIPIESLNPGQRQIVYAMVFDSESNALLHDEYYVLDHGLVDIETLDSFEQLNELVSDIRCAPDEAFRFLDE